jgi:hypothetical protein
MKLKDLCELEMGMIDETEARCEDHDRWAVA